MHLFQFGKGNIGRTLIRQVIDHQEILVNRYGIHLEYIGFCGQSQAILCPRGLHPLLTDDQVIDNVVPASPDHFTYDDPMVLLDQVLGLGLPDLCVIDTTAGDLSNIHLACLRQGIPVVTANKKPIADDYDVYAELQRLGRREKMLYWYETTAGAGLPVISTLHDIIVTGDRILGISGCLSGTLGYICSQLDTARPFSDIVVEAKNRGYTEPDPRDDLNGMDVARKALILARDSGYKLNMSDVQVTGMISKDLEQAKSVDAFMNALTFEDAFYAHKLEASRAINYVLRYMATVKDGQCVVELSSVPKESPAGSLSGPDNLVVFQTERYSDNPLVIRGPGAGPQVTAAGLFGDLVRAANYKN